VIWSILPRFLKGPYISWTLWLARRLGVETDLHRRLRYQVAVGAVLRRRLKDADRYRSRRRKAAWYRLKAWRERKALRRRMRWWWRRRRRQSRLAAQA
jgi:hypothetical protein